MIMKNLMENVRGFMTSRIILTGVELDVFTFFLEEQTLDYFVDSDNLDKNAAERLLNALVAMELLEKNGSTYKTTIKGRLVADTPKSIKAVIGHYANLWKNWDKLTEVVRKGDEGRSKDERNEAELSDFIGAMHVIGMRNAGGVADFYDASKFRKMLDIGGGSGIYTEEFLKRNPYLTSIILDRPDVIPLTKKYADNAGVLHRVEFVEGDYHDGNFPEGYDLCLLSAVIHQNSREVNRKLYKDVLKYMKNGGSLLIRDVFLNDNRTEPTAGVIFAINMLVNTDGGNCYTWEEMRYDLLDAGFSEVRFLRDTNEMDSLIEAVK